ncbi:MAG TPA: hypothetical protein VLV86_09790, partial [Vicinamibacterales bacterium]|nr:hypothetical protein [Vicinamibacterales bacterium]
AVIADSRFTMARLELASMQEHDGQMDRAIANYRAIVDAEPKNVAALNNLAVDLCRQDKPREALVFAERAVALEKSDPAIFDTLAWTQHLLGADRLAVVSIDAARLLGGVDPEILLHAAVIFAAAGDVPRATAVLKASLDAYPALADRPEIKKLQEQLNAAK